MVMKSFGEIVRFAQREDLDWLLRIADDNCTVGVHNSKCMTIEKTSVPWTIALTLRRFHKKHVICAGGCLNHSKVLERLIDFEQGCMWRAQLQTKGSKWTNSWGMLKVPRPPPNKFKGLVPAPLTLWLSELRSAIVQEISRANSVWRRDPRSKHSSMCAATIMKRASMSLSAMSLKAVENDKEPGWTLLSLKDWQLAMNSVMKSENYKMVARIPDTIWVDHEFWVKRIASLEGDASLAQVLRRSMRVPRASPVAMLQITMKPHKPQGEMSFRNLHCSKNYSFSGLGRWVHWCINTKLLDIAPHLLRTTEEVVDRLRNIRPEPDLMLYRFDIKSFYMSGLPHDIAEAASSIFDVGPRRSVVRGASLFLLSSQFIAPASQPSDLYSVEVGTGMGLPQSGALADAALFAVAERGLIDSPSRLAAAGVRCWLRFKDDVLMIAKRGPEARRIFREFQSRAHPMYRVVCAEVSTVRRLPPD